VASESGRASGIDEVRIDSDGGLVVGCRDVPDWASAVLEVRSKCSDEVDMSGITASVEVRGSEAAMDAPGIVVAAGDVSQAECTGVAYVVSVPRAGAGKLDSWVQVLGKVGGPVVG
jgi:hypothetical protein